MIKSKKPIKVIGDRDIVLNVSNPSDYEQISLIGKALSSPVRIQILNLLKNSTLSIQEIASALSIPVSSSASHIKYLEDAKLVVTETQPGVHGSMRVCICSMQSFLLETAGFTTHNTTLSLEAPIGTYYECQIDPTCGLANENGIIDAYDSPAAFYSPNRIQAQLLWFQQGFIEYRFQNIMKPHERLREISFSMELCSEAPGYMEDWPSNITISINGHEVTTYLSPGDFGSRRGKLTPLVWPNGQTQYGLLKTFSVRDDGGYLDKNLVNPHLTIADLHLKEKPCITLRIEVKADAKHVGGINLFGEKYGDFPQGIIMDLIY